MPTFMNGAMPDISIIRETYAGMSDESLFRLACDEGRSLTPEALTLLYREFVKRGMDTEIIASIRVWNYQRRNAAEREERDRNLALLREVVERYAKEGMEEGKSKEDVVEELERLGIPREHALPMLSNLPGSPVEPGFRIDNEKLVVLTLSALALFIAAMAIEIIAIGSVAWFLCLIAYRSMAAFTRMRQSEDRGISATVRDWRARIEEDPSRRNQE